MTTADVSENTQIQNYTNYAELRSIGYSLGFILESGLGSLNVFVSAFIFVVVTCQCFFFGQVVNFFIEVADAKKDEEAKKNLTELRDSPRTIEGFVKSFSYKDSKFKTICHADFWTSQIMFSLNEDGKPLSHTRSIIDKKSVTIEFLNFCSSLVGDYDPL